MSVQEWIKLWREDRWVTPFFKRYRRVLVLALFLGFAAALFAAGLMFSSGYLISGAAGIPESILVLNLPLIFVRIFGLGKPVLNYFERLNSHDWVLRMTSDLRLKLFNALESNALFFRATHRTGDVLGLLAEDIGHLQNLYLRVIFPTIVAWLLWFFLLVVAGFLSPALLVALVVLLGLAVVVAPLVSVMSCGARRMKIKELRNNLYSELTDNVLGISDWVFSQRSEEYLTRHKRAQDILRKLTDEENRFARRRDVMVQICFGMTVVVLLVWAGLRFGGYDTGMVDWIAAFSLGFFPLIDAFAPLSSSAVEASVYGDSLKRLNALPQKKEGEPQDVQTPCEPLDICLKEVTYMYPGASRLVLDCLNLTIPAGQKIAVLGRSGAGKSTVASLIHGDMAPQSGKVAVGGIDASLYGDAMPAYIGVIQQHTYLFNMTLLENVRIGRPEATREQVFDALAQVGLGRLVHRLPEGLDTLVDEAGLRFSGGERHRIALARVLLQDVPIVILDEPCAGLDPLTERALLETLFEVLEDKTVIMVTHHLAGVSEVDRVIFIDEGRVAMDGSPRELKESSAHYQKLLSFDAGMGLLRGK